MEINDKQFIKGFNSGYILAKFEPQMLNLLLKSLKPVSSYISGMRFGQKEYELELKQSHLDEFIQLRQKTSNEKNRDLD